MICLFEWDSPDVERAVGATRDEKPAIRAKSNRVCNGWQMKIRVRFT